MYKAIHDDLFKAITKSGDFRLRERRLNIGAALRQLKAANRIPLTHLIKQSGLNRNSLNAMMQLGEINTTRERLLKIVEQLKVPVDEFIRVAREAAHYNFYHVKKDAAHRFKYRTHDVEVFSPPQFSRKDFIWCLVSLYPGKAINDLIHQTMDQVAGFVTNGHLKLQYGDKCYTIHTNQCFFFDPKIPHAFINEAGGLGTTEFYLVYQLRPESIVKEARGRKSSPVPISTAVLIEQIRKELSSDPDRPLPMSALAALSGIRLDALTHLRYRKTKIIPFEKIDLLANLTDYSFENIIQKTENRYQGRVQVFTDQDKALVDLSLRHGIFITNHSGIGVGKRKFSISDVTFEPWKEGLPRKEWKYQGVGFIGLSVERGLIGVQYGQQPLITLTWGEKLYFNANVEIKISNLLSHEKANELGESSEPKIMLFSLPPVV